MPRLVDALWTAIKKFNQSDGWYMSSHIALSMMLALFPFLIFALSLTSGLMTDIEANDLIELVFGSWPDEVAEPIENEVRAVFALSGGQTLTIGGLAALYFASNGVDAVRVSLTKAYRDVDRRPFWYTRLLCLVFVLCGAIILAIAAGLMFAVPLQAEAMQAIWKFRQPAWLSNEFFRSALTMGLLVFSVLACHLWLPPFRRSLREILPGVALTIVCWALSAKLFAYYLGTFASYSVTYAGLAGTMAALVFLYLMAAILIIGAELNGALIEA